MRVILISLALASLVHGAPRGPAANKKARAWPQRARVVFEQRRRAPKKGRRRSASRRTYLSAGRGAVIRTGESTVTVFIGGNATLRLKPSTTIRFSELRLEPGTGRSDSLIEILKGKVLFKIRKLAITRSSLRVRTPTAVVAVRGTVFIMDAAKPGRTKVEVLEGKLDTYPAAEAAADGRPASDAKILPIAAGMEADYESTQKVGEARAIDSEELAQANQWRGESEPASEPAQAEEERPEQAREAEESVNEPTPMEIPAPEESETREGRQDEETPAVIEPPQPSENPAAEGSREGSGEDGRSGQE